MGNVKSSDFAETDPDENATFLKLKSTALLSDTFVNSATEKLPLYGFPKYDSDKPDSEASEAEFDEHSIRLQKLLAVLSNDPETKNLKVEDYSELHMGDLLSDSGFHVMNAKRSRVLLRVLQAYYTFLDEYRTSRMSDSGVTSNFFRVAPVSNAIGRLDTLCKERESDSKDALLSMSIVMTMSLAASLSKSDVTILQMMLKNLLESLSSFSPLSLSQRSSGDHTQLHEAVTTVMKFTADLQDHENLEVRSLSASLQLLFGLLTGSLSSLVETASRLLKVESGLDLHPAAIRLLEKCLQIQPSYDLHFPSTKYVSDRFPLSLDLTPSLASLLKSCPAGLSIAISAENSCLYLYNHLINALYKIGTGYGDHFAGEVITINKTVTEEVKQKKGIEESQNIIAAGAKLTVLKDKVYVRLVTKLLSEYETVVLNSETLTVEDIIDLKPTVASFLDKAVEGSKAETERIVVNLEKDNSLALFACSNYKIQLVSAFIDNLTDITALISSCVYNESTIFIADIQQVIETFYRENNMVSSIRPLSLIVTVKYQYDLLAATKLSVTIGSDLNSLIVISNTAVLQSSTKQGSRKNDCCKVVYNLNEVLEITSASTVTKNGENNDNIVDVTKEVKEQYHAALKLLLTSPSSNNRSEVMEALFNTQFQEITNNQADCIITISYEVQGDIHGITFNSKCEWDLFLVHIQDACTASLSKTTIVNKSYCLHITPESLGVIKYVDIPISEPSKALKPTSILTNTYHYMFLDVGKTSCENVHYKGLTYNTNDSIDSKYTSSVFSKSLALPTDFAYDMVHNVNYGIDVYSQEIIKWNNPSNSPILLPSSSDESDNHLLKKSPIDRRQYLNKNISKDYGLLLLTLLESLAEPFGCSFSSFISDLNRVNEIKIVVKTETVGENAKNKSSIILNNLPVVVEDEFDGDWFGYLIIVLYPHNYQLYKKIWIDNEHADSEIANMIMFIDSIPKDYIVVVVNVNCLHDSMTPSAYEMLTTIGVIDLQTLVDDQTITQLVCIGRKGLAVGQAELFLSAKHESITVHKVFPPIEIPFALDCSQASIKQLINFARGILANILSGVNSEQLLCQLCSILRILQVNIFHLLTQSDISLLLSTWEVEASALQSLLTDLIKQDFSHLTYLHEAVLALFIASFKLVYSNQAEQLVLLKHYASSFSSGKITTIEMSLLEVLLKRFADPAQVLFLNEAGNVNCSLAKDVIEVITIQIISTPANNNSYDRIHISAVSLLYSLTKLLLSADSKLIFTNHVAGDRNDADEEQGRGELALQVIHTIVGLATNILTIALQETKQGDLNEKAKLAMLHKLKASPVGSVIPLAISALSGIVAKGSYTLLSKSLENIVQIIDKLFKCSQIITAFLSVLPPICQEYDNAVGKKHTLSNVYESIHPYRSNMDETTTVSFPGALSVLITFDPRSRTESECDYIVFRDMDNNDLFEGRKMTGRDGSENYPGTGNRPPLTIPLSEFKFHFHSDGSVEDWGYKFTAQAIYPPKKNQLNRQNWLLKVSFDIVEALGTIGRILIRGPNKVEVESKYAHYLENSLVKPELFLYKEYDLSAEDMFLQDLVDRKEGSSAEKFLRIMKMKVMEDRGGIEDINSAVYATCAAIIKANNLTREAMAVANSVRQEASPALCKAWRSGQKMRSYFDLKDVHNTVDSSNSNNSINKVSLYAGAGQDVVQKASLAVVERAKFLLRTPLGLTETKQDSCNESTTEEGKSQTSESVSHLSPYSLPQTTSPLIAESPPTPSHSGDRWKLAAKAVALHRQVSDDTRNVATMWHSLVDEAVVVDKLKNMLLHRRRFAERSRQGKQLTITEKVLQFIQSDAAVNKLQEINSVRNKRAIIRAKGLDVFAQLLSTDNYPFSTFIATTSLYLAFQSIKKEDGVVHYSNDTEGCSPEQQVLLYQKFSQLLKGSVQILLNCCRMSNDEKKHALWRLALVSTMSVCSMDYEYSDHSLVLESGLVDALERILTASTDMQVSAKCRSIFEILVKRFLVLESAGEGPSEPTDTSKRLMQVMSSLLSNAAGTDLKAPKTVEYFKDFKDRQILKSSAVLTGDGSTTAYVLPSHHLEAKHSICFSLLRPKSQVIDGKLEGKDLVGKLVMRGLAWEEDTKKSDGGLGALGKVTSYNIESKVAKVKWSGSKEFDYNLDLEQASSELNLADPKLGGFLFSRGDAALISGLSLFNGERDVPLLTAMQALLLPDASLLIVYLMKGREPVLLRSNSKIQASEWTQISLVCDHTLHCKLFINGTLDAGIQLASASFLEKDCVTFESEHPMAKQGSMRKEYRLQGAAYTIITADERINLPNELGAVSFFREGDERAVWSNAADDNARTLQDFESLVVPGGKVVCDYTAKSSDGDAETKEVKEADNWGFQFYLFGVQEDLKQQLEHFSVLMPIYIGHPPAFVSTSVCNLTYGFSGFIADFTVYSNSSLNKKETLGQEALVANNTRKPVDDISALSLFGILRKAVDDLDSLSDTSLRRSFANTGLLDTLFEFMACGSALMRSAAFHLAATILPLLDVELVDGLALRHGLANKDCNSFAEYLLDSIGQHLCSLPGTTHVGYGDVAFAAVKESAADMAGILSSQVKLLRAMTCGRDVWCNIVAEMVGKILQQSSATINDLVARIGEEIKQGDPEQVSESSSSQTNYFNVQALFGLIAFLGYDVAGLYAGASVIYTEPESGAEEEGIVIGVTRPPLLFDSVNKSKTQEKLAKLWDTTVTSHGEAICAALNSQPYTPTILPTRLIRPVSAGDLPVRFHSFLANYAHLDRIVSLIENIAAVDLMDYRPKPVPVVSTSKKQLVFESAHPYADNLDIYEEISIPGADSLTIEFDEKSLTETNCDHVQFFDSRMKTTTYGTKFWGRNGDENFPGFGGRDALIIPRSSCLMHFHSDSSTNDWGYKFTVTAIVKNVTEPPNMPLLPYYSLLAQLKMTSLKAFSRLLSVSDLSHQSLFCRAFDKLLPCVLLPRPANFVRKATSGSKLEIMFESNHPYEDSLDQYIPVHVPKAKKMTITFDPETRTENNCDYLILYADDSRSERVAGSDQYSGGKDGGASNWPGMGGREPLVIECDSFVIHFHSDGSVNDWGWRMFIVAEVAGDSDEPRELLLRGHDIHSAAIAESCYLALKDYARDGVKSYAGDVRKKMSSFVLEKPTIVNTYYVDAIAVLKQEPKRKLLEESKEENSLIESKQADSNARGHSIGKVLRVNGKDSVPKIIFNTSVPLYSEQNGEEVTGTIEKNTLCYIDKEDGHCLKLAVINEDGQGLEGWLSIQDSQLELPFSYVKTFTEPAITINATVSADSTPQQAKKRTTNPMFTVEEKATGCRPKAADSMPYLSHITLLKQDLEYLDVAICDYAVTGSILYANECVFQLISKWPSGHAFTPEYFGSLSGLLTFLNMHVASMKSTSLTDSNGNTVKAVMDLLLSSSTEVSVSLLDFSFASLSYLSNPPMSSNGTLVRRGRSQDFESMHPYDNNMDNDWQFTFPGAKRLEIAFDSRSSTETDCDFLTVFDMDKDKTLYKPKIHGYASDMNKHWPGVNAPRVVLEGVDKCVINFKSDGGTNDWGFKGTVFAIYEQPSELELEEAKDSNKNTSLGQLKDYSKLSVWIIYFMVSQKALASSVHRSLYSVENFATLSSYFVKATDEVKTVLIDVFVVFCKEVASRHSSLSELREQLVIFEQVIASYAQTLYAKDTDDGKELNMVSPTLQSVAQLMVSLDNVLFDIRHNALSQQPVKNNLECRDFIREMHVNGVDMSVRHMTWMHNKEERSKSQRWDLHIEQLASASSLSIGLVPRHLEEFKIEYKDHQLLVTMSDEANYSVEAYGRLAKELQTGDTVSVLYDKDRGYVEFHINEVSLGIAVGLPCHNAAIEMDLQQRDMVLTASMGESDRLTASLSHRSSATRTNVPGGEVGMVFDWLSPLYDTHSLLSSLSEQKIPHLILGNKFLPYCNKKHRVEVCLADEELKDSVTFEREVRYNNALCVNLALHEVKLNKGERLEVLDSKGRVRLTLEGEREDVYSTPLDSLLFSATAWSFSGRRERLRKKDGVKVGDTVVRGRDWCYGGQDGGIGGKGRVVKLEEYKGEKEKGVVVQWEAGSKGLYRNNFNEAQDVSVLDSEHKSNNTATSVSAQGFFRIEGEETLLLRLSLSKEAEGERRVKLTFFPCYRLYQCVEHPDFQSYLSRLSSLYVVRNRAGLRELVRAVNRKAREKTLSKEELLEKKFEDFAPQGEELLRSRALKDLAEQPAESGEEEEEVEGEGVDFALLDEGEGEGEGEGGVEGEKAAEEGNGGERERTLEFSGPHENFTIMGAEAYWGGVCDFDSEESAQLAVKDLFPQCGGFVRRGGVFYLREGGELEPREGEAAWIVVEKGGTSALAEAGAKAGEGLGGEVEAIVDMEPEGEEEGEQGRVGVEDVVLRVDMGDESHEDSDSEEESSEEESSEEESDEDSDEEEEGAEEEERSVSSDILCTDLFGSDSPAPSTAPASPASPVRGPPCGKCGKACRKHPGGTWHTGWSCDWPEHQGANSFRGEDAVFGCETIVACNWGVCAACWGKVTAQRSNLVDEKVKQILKEKALSPIACQFRIVQLLNVALVKSLHFIDLTRASLSPLSSLLSLQRGLVFEAVKVAPLMEALTLSEVQGGRMDLPLSRVKARRYGNNNKVDTEGRWSVFAQAFRALHPLSPRLLRRTDKLYTVQFQGEHAQDAGGPYRESFSLFCQELQSPTLPLLLRTPNGRHALGHNRERFLLSPLASTPTQLSMLSFLGKLMGVAVRSKEYLSLSLAPLVWKKIVGERVDRGDLEGVDYALVKSLEMLENIEETGMDSSTFSSTFFETFSALSSADTLVPLLPGGEQKEVTLENCKEYTSLVFQYRLRESDRQVAALREGLATLVPLPLLSLFTGEEVEEMVCGSPEVDVALLQQVTEYSGCAASDEHIGMFWEIMRGFNNEERSAFVKFAWGRSRLPLTAAAFSQRFKIQNFNKQPADSYFPVSHTCFFSVELPRYSSSAVMREKLLYAIFNCEAIDGDETGLAAANMGYEDSAGEED